PMDLGGELGTMAIDPAGEAPLPEGCRVVLREGGERFRAAADRPSRAVKDLLREGRVPTWLRAAVPLLRSGEEIIAIGDWLLADSLSARLHSRAARLRWRPAHPALRAVRQACHDRTEGC
ncbi:MAG: tRNA lysidine(34) synthetase TilS, partial [Gammaproteobacteria bacterium]